MIIKYRSEIDGLRAIAVIPVIFFHSGFEIFSGGFVGVDVFFVISGYLITTIILEELNNNTFSLKNFYERRARRILPVLIFVILVTSIISFIFLTRSEIASYFKSVIATLLFFSNFYFWKTAPYFKSESDLEPLLHTWSLSIEEQFYIMFPITLVIFYKFFRNHIFLLFIFSFISSFIICQFLASKTAGGLNFYFTLSRIWELALGSICAYLLIYKNLSPSNLIKNLFSIIGLFLILFSIFAFNKQTIYPSFYALLPTIGTALIILFANEKTFVKKILSIRLLIVLGLMSYSLYLWHQPLLAFGRIFFEQFSLHQKYISLLLTFLCSIFSYNFIEKIFRNKNKIHSKTFIKIISFTLIPFIIFSFLSIDFFTSKNSTEALLAKLLLKNDAVYYTKMDERKFVKSRIIYENLNPKILVIGSSRALQISNKNFNRQVLNLSVSGASIQDQIAITEMALEKFEVDKILLGVDPWLLNDNSRQSRWKSISKEYQISLKNIRSKSNKNKILKKDNLIESYKSYNFYEKILDKIYILFNIRKLDLEINKDEINSLTKDYYLRDGRYVYGKKEHQEKLKGVVIKYSMNEYKFSESNYVIYKSFIEHLINFHEKEVILVLSPYHPPSYELTIVSKPFYLDLENKFKKLSEELNIKIIGSYNPLKIPCNQNEFYDDIHPKNSCMIKITNQLR